VLWLLVLIYATFYWLGVPWKGSWGIHWGVRYLVVLYPLLAVPCAINISAWFGWALDRGPSGGRTGVLRWGAVAVAAIVVASFAAQVLSLDLLQRKMGFSSRLNREVAGRPEEAILTDQWWVGHELYGQFDRRAIFLVTTPGDYDRLAARLAARGISNVLFVAPTIPGAAPEPGAVQVSDEGLNYWNLDLVPLKLGVPAGPG